MRSFAGAVLCVALVAGGSSAFAETPTGNQSDKAKVAAAKKATRKIMAAPTAIGVDVPLEATPPSGKEIYYLECGVPICKEIGDFFAEAADNFGWQITRVDAGLTPETVTAAYEQALADKPDGIVGGPFGRNQVGDLISEYGEAGIPYVAQATRDKVGDGLIAMIAPPQDFFQSGKILTDYITSDSGGSAKVALFDDLSIDASVSHKQGFEKAMKKQCPDCDVDFAEVSVSDIATQIPTQVVSYVQANPDVEYLVFGLGDYTIGVANALRAAGLHDQVEILSRGGNPLNFQSITEGSEVATVGESSKAQAWAFVDALARFYNDQDLDCCEWIRPKQLLTADNIDDPNAVFTGPDIEEHYKNLWGLS